MSSVPKVLRATLSSSVALAAVLILGVAPSASAGFKMKFDDTLTVPNPDKLYVDSDFDGIITIPSPPPFTTAGSFTLTNGVGLSKPDMGTATSPSMDLQAGVRRFSGTRTMKVYLTDTSFTGVGIAKMAIGGTSQNSSVTYET